MHASTNLNMPLIVDKIEYRIQTTKMAKSVKAHTYLLFNVILCFVICFQAHAVPYDSKYISDCLEEPPSALYEGGIVVNSELNHGLKGWKPFAGAKIQHVTSYSGNNFIVTYDRTKATHSFAQKIHLEVGKHYSISAWLQVNLGKADVVAILKTKTGNIALGLTIAHKGCWSMLKGGLVANKSGRAYLYFGTKEAVDIWADSISVQPFTSQEWEAHQNHSIHKVRKTIVRLQVLDKAGRPVPNAAVSLKQSHAQFAFGCAMNQNILKYDKYKNWFKSKFTNKYTVFENELKWPQIEPYPGGENYTTADAMVDFAKENGMKIRGHNVFWDKDEVQSEWVRELPSAAAIRNHTSRRIQSVMKRYRGKFIHWDVVNENMHTDFFESRLSDTSFSGEMYRKASEIDPVPTPFLNEYNTIECRGCGSVPPRKYLDKIDEIRAQGYNGKLGIGLQGHFTDPDTTYIRAALDTLAIYGLPIWITELDIKYEVGPEAQAQRLNDVLKELHSHEAVEGIILWSAWSEEKCFEMCLTDDNFDNLKTGDVVDEFMGYLAHAGDAELRGGTTDLNGFFEASLFHGVYNVELRRVNGSMINSDRKTIHARPRNEKLRVHRFTIHD